MTGPFSFVRLIGDREAIEKVTTSWDKIVVDRSAGPGRDGRRDPGASPGGCRSSSSRTTTTPDTRPRPSDSSGACSVSPSRARRKGRGRRFSIDRFRRVHFARPTKADPRRSVGPVSARRGRGARVRSSRPGRSGRTSRPRRNTGRRGRRGGPRRRGRLRFNVGRLLSTRPLPSTIAETPVFTARTRGTRFSTAPEDAHGQVHLVLGRAVEPAVVGQVDEQVGVSAVLRLGKNRRTTCGTVSSKQIAAASRYGPRSSQAGSRPKVRLGTCEPS